MITLTREEAQQVLDALESFCEYGAILKPLEVRDLLRARLSAPEPKPKYTYASTQATKCAGCGEYKHTPLRVDAMNGYVCLTCIYNKLGSLLGEFGYPEPEPVAYLLRKEFGFGYETGDREDYGAIPVYTTPPQREWQGLTDEDFVEYCKTLNPLWNTRISRTEAEAFFRAGAAKLREKNS